MTTTGRVLIAADKFKGSLTAVEVAECLTAGIRRARPDAVLESLPVADGGDGTVEAAVAAGYERHERTVTGPLGGPVAAAFALSGETAVVEMAEASGLSKMPVGVHAPLTATTYGTGELLLAAVESGARRVVLGVGGSATTDGGTGMLAALGARFLDEDGDPVPAGGGPLVEMVSADLSGVDERLRDVEVVLASDVDNPLTGPKGAAHVYAPQKGATPQDVQLLDAALTHFVQVMGTSEGARAAELAEAPGAGAAGGIGYGALLGLNATFRPGIDVLLEVLGFADALERSALVITGEGSLDRQTLHGKAPAGVAAAARKTDRPVLAVCGRLGLDAKALKGAGIEAAYALTDIEPDVDRCMFHAGTLLEQLGERLAEEWL